MSYENLKLSVRREKATVTVLRVTVHFELCNIVCTVCYCVHVHTAAAVHTCMCTYMSYMNVLCT